MLSAKFWGKVARLGAIDGTFISECLYLFIFMFLLIYFIHFYLRSGFSRSSDPLRLQSTIRIFQRPRSSNLDFLELSVPVDIIPTGRTEYFTMHCAHTMSNLPHGAIFAPKFHCTQCAQQIKAVSSRVHGDGRTLIATINSKSSFRLSEAKIF